MFVVQEEKVVRKNVTILEQKNGQIRVSGLTENDLLIISNTNLVKPGDLIEIVGN